MSRSYLISYILKVADVTTGMDILARAQFWEGAAGYKPFQKLQHQTSDAALLTLIKKLMEEVSPGLSTHPEASIWAARGNTMFYKPVLMLASAKLESKGMTGADMLQADMMRTDLVGSVFYAAGVGSRHRQEKRLKAGEILVPEATNLAKRFMINHAIDALRKGKRRQEILREEGGDVVTETMGESLDAGEWLGVIAQAISNPDDPLGQKFIEWMVAAAPPQLGPYLGRVLRGDAVKGQDYAREMGISEVKLSTMKTKYLQEVARRLSDKDMESSSTPQFLKDLANRASLQGEGGQTLRMARSLRAKVIRLAAAHPTLRPHLLPLLV